MARTIYNLCSKHQDQPTDVYCATCARIGVERKIVLMCAKSLIAKGYSIAVNDGCETTTNYTGDIAVIEAALFTTDEDYLLTHKRGCVASFVRFVYGNSGPDVINDYGMSLEPVMEAVNAFADRQPAHNG